LECGREPHGATVVRLGDVNPSATEARFLAAIAVGTEDPTPGATT
jgi:hypothetical protein